MNILLDTHVFLWWTMGNEQLPSEWRQALESPDNRVYLSSASVWEITIKQSLGRIRLEDPARFVHEYLTRYDILPLVITHAHALAVHDLPPQHKDPFDRMLIAQARCEGMTLASADEAVRRYDVRLLDAPDD